METKYITDKKGKKISVILPVKDYEEILKRLEELEDIKSYDEAIKNNDELIPVEQAFQEIESKRNPH